MARARKLSSAEFFSPEGRIIADNAAILNTVRDAAPADYKQRIPIATQGNMSQVLKAMNSYQPNWDVFWNVFVGTIGRWQINNRLGFKNPLKGFKKASLDYGMTIEEIQSNLIKARQYDPKGANVFGREGREPDIRTNFHMQNRENVYEINIPMQDVLRGAFNDGASIGAFFSSLTEVSTDSAENDEYRLMLELLAHYAKYEGFYNINTGAFSGSDEEIQSDARKLARAMRAMNTKLGYFHTRYSPEGRNAGLATRANSTVLIVKSDVDAAMTVDSYAYAFNRADAQLIADRIVVVDEFPEELSAYNAFLLDSEWFQVADTLGPVMLDSGLNPENMSYNYFYHIWQVLSYSRFLPAVSFSTLPDTQVTAVTSTPDGVAITDGQSQSTGTAAVGDVVALTAKVTGTGTPSQAVRYEVKAYNGKGNVRTLPATCYVDSIGQFHTKGLHPLDKVVITAVCLANESLTADYTLTIAGGTAVTKVATTPATTATVTEGADQAVTLTFTPESPTDATYQVYSTDPATAEVTGITATGFNIHGVKKGSATVIVIANGGDPAAATPTASIAVTVNEAGK